MVQASNLGYPRIGIKRELKKALEQFWSGKSSETEVLEQAVTLRKQHCHHDQARTRRADEEAGQSSRASRWRTSGIVRGSRACRAGVADPEAAGGEVEPEAVAHIPAR